MKAELLAGLTPEDKAKRKAILYGSADGLQVIEDHLRKKVEQLQASRLGKQDYGSPSWALMQADKVGELRALLEVIDLLTLDRENNG